MATCFDLKGHHQAISQTSKLWYIIFVKWPDDGL